MAENPRESNELIESLAALEHEQWIAWSKAVAHEVSEDRRKRWETYWVPYNDLDEDVKEKDREWARKVAEVLVPDNGGINAPTTGVGPGRDITLRLNVDVSDALTGLKALRREADAATRALKQLAEAKRGINGNFSEWDVYIDHIREIAGKHYRSRDINYRVFKAIWDAKDCGNQTVTYRRGEGATTSAVAATKTFDSAIMIVPTRDLRNRFREQFDLPHIYTIEDVRGWAFRDIDTAIIDDAVNVSGELPEHIRVVSLMLEVGEKIPKR
ncbi:hypothetical protein [Brevibacillus sp. NL20B1]|uniref:hypothetical protein n=1 Tax=Brevibacillus sp. NL20B1 TaxID=2829799 RepID=UPI001B8F5291|nr:hypothetical protein [Brevibacillus sp. NL20B1]MBR8661142.1 hypothetical protein [Brevibacillus sp. NL20B1]